MSLIILDRDGVINYDSTEYIKSPDEWEAIPGSLEAIAQLNRMGFRVVIVTNQSGVARGLYDLEILDQIHEKLLRELSAVGGCLEEILFCPHHPDDNCPCRKPKPGLFYIIKKKYGIELTETFFVGDSLSDIQAAHAAGCKPILVLTGNGKKTLANNPTLSLPYFENLAAVAQHIMETCEKNLI